MQKLVNISKPMKASRQFVRKDDEIPVYGFISLICLITSFGLALKLIKQRPEWFGRLVNSTVDVIFYARGFLMNRFFLNSFATIFFLLANQSAFADPGAFEEGRITLRQIEAGEFHEYVPRNLSQNIEVLVVCHGSVFDNGPSATKLARKFIERWVNYSEATGFILVAPAFDVTNFGGGGSPPGGSAWGYRALDGKSTTPDDFVERIVDRYRGLDPDYDGSFFLYGHSAGAQFANHYLVVHPERLKGVVLSAPAIYAMPDPAVPWPLGMKATRRQLKWGEVTKVFEISHDMETWRQAVKVPVAVVIGTADTKRLSNKPQQGGWTRLDRALHYVSQMRSFAVKARVLSRIFLFPVPNVGHSSEALTPASISALRKIKAGNIPGSER